MLGEIFESRPTKLTPLPASRLMGLLFPPQVQLCHARASSPSERVAFLIHGLGFNEDYFGLVVPHLIAEGYDVWALRLPGYVASGEDAGLWPTQFGLSLQLYGWVAASAMAHLTRTLEPRPTEMLAWGHSLGAAVLHSAIDSFAGPEWRGPDHLVFEAPAFGEVIAFNGATIAGFTAVPDGVLNQLANAFLLDDVRTNEFARRQCEKLVPGRTSRPVFTMNVLALINPLNSTRSLATDFRARSSFIMGEIDRLIDHDRLAQLLDTWEIARQRRLVLPRNHLLALTCSEEIVDWLVSWSPGAPQMRADSPRGESGTDRRRS